MIDTHFRKYADPILNLSAKKLLKLKITANQVTFLALFIGCGAGYFVYIGKPILALLLLWFSGFLDALDGAMARLSKSSPFGAVLDVGFDRLVESAIIIGLGFRNPQHFGILLILTVSILYGITIFLTIGAVVANKGIKSFHYATGIAERTEGFLLLSLMVVFQNYLFYTTLLFIIIEVFSTVLRIFEAKKNLESY